MGDKQSHPNQQETVLLIINKDIIGYFEEANKEAFKQIHCLPYLRLGCNFANKSLHFGQTMADDIVGTTPNSRNPESLNISIVDVEEYTTRKQKGKESARIAF